VRDPGLAIVIPVLNEVGNIGALLDDCAAQTLAPLEVVVVDAGSTDGTLELLEERAVAWPSLRIVRAPGVTPGAGRNAGIEQTEANRVVTLDAGSRIDPGWLAALAPDAQADDVVSIGVATADARSAFEAATGWLTLRAFKPQSAKGPLGRPVTPAGRNGYFFTVAAWRRAGGFPEELPWGEDKVFLQRLQEQGLELRVVPGAVVRWRPRGTVAELYRQYRRYALGDAMAGIDRRNSLATLALYTLGALIATAAIRQRGPLRAVAPGLAFAYLGLFTAAAARDLTDRRALAWVPVVRLTVDMAKLHGLLEAWLGGARRLPPVQARDHN
jgi:glycosyltransferase involved in cell wall biosynthesis